MLFFYPPPHSRHVFPRSYSRRLLATTPAAYWPMWEATGGRAQSLTVSTATEDLLAYGTFETLHSVETFAGWVDRAGTGAIADEGVLVHAGSHACKLTRGVDDNLWVSQDINLVPGDTLALSLWARGDGSVAGRYALYDLTNSAWIIAMTTTGVTAAGYAEVTATPTVPAACYRARLYLAGPTGAGSVYFDDVTLTGVGTLHGSYSPTGVTLGQPGIGDAHDAPAFSGTATSVLIGCPRFDSLWNGDRGAAIVWGQMSAAQWTDTAEHRYLFHVKSAADPNFYLVFGKQDVAHTLFWRRKVGAGKATNEEVYAFSPTGPADTWFCMGMTWSQTAPRLRGYLYVPGLLPFTRVFNIAGTDVDVWGTNPANDYNTTLMAGATEAQEFAGLGAHACYWDRLLTLEQMQHVMVL